VRISQNLHLTLILTPDSGGAGSIAISRRGSSVVFGEHASLLLRESGGVRVRDV
jgi:hypothetical protein